MIKLEAKIVNGFLKIHRTTAYNTYTEYIRLSDISEVLIDDSDIRIYGVNGFVQGDRYSLFWFSLAHYKDCKQDYEICYKHLKEVLIGWLEEM